MRSKKPYSNVTFTKRVDHEGGEHRGPRAMAEPAACEECGAVRVGRRWTTHPGDAARAKASSVVPRPVLCPACRQAREGEPRGFVTLGGGFLAAHRDEVERLLSNEAARAAEDNPLARILGRRWDRTGALTVSTTTEHLAQRLGHALERSFGGETTYVFSHENKLARVAWRRD
jgi:hypothetical protein